MSCFWILNTTFFVRHFCFTFLFMDALTEREWLGQYWCWLRAALPSVLCKPNWRPNCTGGLMGASLRRRTPHTAHRTRSRQCVRLHHSNAHAQNVYYGRHCRWLNRPWMHAPLDFHFHIIHVPHIAYMQLRFADVISAEIFSTSTLSVPSLIWRHAAYRPSSISLYYTRVVQYFNVTSIWNKKKKKTSTKNWIRFIGDHVRFIRLHWYTHWKHLITDTDTVVFVVVGVEVAARNGIGCVQSSVIKSLQFMWD